MFLHDTFTSLNDYPNEVSLFLALQVCENDCPFCFNKDLAHPERLNQVSISEVKNHIDSSLPFITAICFGGADVILQLHNCYEVAQYAEEQGLKVGMQVSRIRPEEADWIVRSFPLSYISVTVNCCMTSAEHKAINILSKSDFILEIKLIDIPQKTNIGTFLTGLKYDSLVVQQFQNSNCLDPEYNKIPQPNRDEVMEYAKSIGADYIITKEKGREKVI